MARKISKLFEDEGWSVWWDRKIPIGKTWRNVLEEALQNMRCMVVLWSANSIKSEWVKEEAEEGKTQAQASSYSHRIGQAPDGVPHYPGRRLDWMEWQQQFTRIAAVACRHEKDYPAIPGSR